MKIRIAQSIVAGIMVSGCYEKNDKYFRNIEAVEVLFTEYVEADRVNRIGLTDIPPSVRKTLKQINWSLLELQGEEPVGQSIHRWEVEAITLVWFDGRTPRALNLLKSGQVICDSGEVFGGAGSAYQAIIDQLVGEKLINDKIPDIPYAPIPKAEN